MANHDEDDEKTILKKQAERERTRIIKLRYNEESPEEIQRLRESQSARSLPLVPIALLIVATLGAGRLFATRGPIIPNNALTPTMMAPNPGQPGSQSASAPTAAEIEAKYKIDPPVSDAEVKRMLAEMNNSPAGPGPVSPASTGQMLNFSGAQTPEMVRVQGKWFKKNEENIYRVNGQNIYYEDRRKERR